MALIDILSSLEITMVIATHRELIARKLATHLAVMEEGVISGPYPRESGMKRKDVKGLLF